MRWAERAYACSRGWLPQGLPQGSEGTWCEGGLQVIPKKKAWGEKRVETRMESKHDCSAVPSSFWDWKVTAIAYTMPKTMLPTPTHD